MASNPVVPSNLNPGEVALAVIGVRAVVSRAVEKINADQRRQMAAYDKIVRKRARELVADEIKCGWPEPPSYRPLLRDLTQPLDQHQVEAMLAPLDPETQTAFLPLAANAFLYLQAALPRSVSKSLAGFQQLPVDDPSWFRFAGLLRVLDDPLQVLELAAGGALMRYQVAAVRELFPGVAQAIDAALTAAIIEAKGRDRNYELPAAAETGVSVWFGMPTITVPTGAVYAQANAKRDQQPQPSKGQLSPAAQAALTDADAAQFPRA